MSGRRAKGKKVAEQAMETPDESMQVDEQEGGYDFENAEIDEDEEGGQRIGDIYIPPPVPPHCSTKSTGARLMISKIVNYNFKSYAKEVIVGPFHHQFTAIIGPNGSGKSNVIDSMLFVFGYRANKIRCKKISTLIHNSAIYPNVQSCSVQVHFKQILDHEDGTIEDIPNSEFYVERRAFADNSSYYLMNKRRVHFKEVASVLKKHHVDLDHNRFLILQGEVESISLMKAKGANENETGMLEYLEDIVGTTRYIKPLQQISESIEKLSMERAEKHNRCTMAEREMNDLEPAYNEAAKYLKEKNKHQHTVNKLIQFYMKQTNEHLEVHVKERDTTFEELKAHDLEYEELKKERTAKEAEARAELKHFEDLEKKKEEIKKNLEIADRKYTELQQILQRTNDQRKQEKVDIDKNEKALVKLEKIPAINDEKIAEDEKKIEDLTKQQDILEKKLKEGYEKVEKMMAPLVKQRESLDGEKIALQANVDKAKTELNSTESKLRLLTGEETNEMRKYQNVKNDYEEHEKELSTKTAEREKIKHRLPELEKECAIRMAQMKKLQQDESNLKVKLNAMNSDLREKSEAMRAQREQHHANKVVAFLMKQKDEGKIPGVLGRLGDLGGIPKKYGVAISMCCGRLDNIVVDTINTATTCINALKQFDIGRATFIALEKIAHLANESGPIKLPPGALRLYDLIKVEDERVLPAFYFSLRNTLVADNLDEATRIAYGATRFRTVTLKGEIIELAGTMAGGGGNRQIAIKIGTEVRTKTVQDVNTSISTQGLEELEREAERLQSQVNYSQQEQGRLESELVALRNQKRQAESDLQKLHINIASLERTMPELKKIMIKQKDTVDKTKTDAAQVKALEATIGKQKETLKDAEQAINKVEKKIEAVQKEIDKLLDDNVKSVQKDIDSKKKSIGKLNGDIAKLNAEKAKTEREIVKIKQKIESSREAIAKAETDIRTLCVERDECDEKSAQLGRDLKEAEEVIVTAKSQSSGVQKEIARLQKLENGNKLKRVEIEEKLQAVVEKINKNKAELPAWQIKLEKLKLEEIPGQTDPLIPLKTYTNEELDEFNAETLQYEVTREEAVLQNIPQNMAALDDYIHRRDVYLQRVQSLEEITARRNDLRQLFDNVRRKRYEEFMLGFTIITKKLKEMYQLITQGGNAELELVDSMDPFNEGVSFSVRPPKKTWKNIANLSGGEKTLASLSLVFALHYYKPSPLYFMDEIDAALDFKNISIVAHYIKERTKNAQFIIISLRTNMFELSDYLVGIYKIFDCTKSVTLENKEVDFRVSSQMKVPVNQNANAANTANKDATNAPQAPQSSQVAQISQIENNENLLPRYTNFEPEIESTARPSQMLQAVQDSVVDEQGTEISTAEATAVSVPIPMGTPMEES